MSDDFHPENFDLFQSPDEAFQHLRFVGTQKDEDIDLGEAALAMGLVFLPGVHVDRYRQHLRKLAEQVKTEYESRLRLKEDDTLKMRVQVLRKIIHEAHGYQGDEKNYDDIQNANLIRVIERRRGMPVALGIFYVILARKMGWEIDGLNFPGHFILRPAMGGERLIIDPFHEGKVMAASDLRNLLKTIVGDKAELSHHYYDTVSTRDILIRLANNLKKRLIDLEDYGQAIIVLEAMEALSPNEYRVLFDKGVLYAKLGQNKQAISALESYVAKTPHAREKHDANILLQQLKTST